VGTQSEQPETVETCRADFTPCCPVEVFAVFVREGEGLGETCLPSV